MKGSYILFFALALLFLILFVGEKKPNNRRRVVNFLEVEKPAQPIK